MVSLLAVNFQNVDSIALTLSAPSAIFSRNDRQVVDGTARAGGLKRSEARASESLEFHENGSLVNLKLVFERRIFTLLFGPKSTLFYYEVYQILRPNVSLIVSDTNLYGLPQGTLKWNYEFGSLWCSTKMVLIRNNVTSFSTDRKNRLCLFT